MFTVRKSETLAKNKRKGENKNRKEVKEVYILH